MRSSLLTMTGVAALAVTAYSAPISKQAQQEMAQPVNCATAAGDTRTLQAAKANVGKEMANGVGAIVPISLVANVVKG